jgi:pentatricopeptide repeat protein
MMIFREMKEAGVEPDVITYTSLISACQKCRMWDDAFALYKEMEDAGGQSLAVRLVHLCPLRAIRHWLCWSEEGIDFCS